MNSNNDLKYQSAGADSNEELTTHQPTGVDREEMSDEAIEIIQASKERFSKRDRLNTDLVRWLQYIAAFPLDGTLIY